MSSNRERMSRTTSTGSSSRDRAATLEGEYDLLRSSVKQACRTDFLHRGEQSEVRDECLIRNDGHLLQVLLNQVQVLQAAYQRQKTDVETATIKIAYPLSCQRKATARLITSVFKYPLAMGGLLSSRHRSLPCFHPGPHSVGCADLMLHDTNASDSGVYMRVFYPTSEKELDDKSTNADWLTRQEYLEGLAAYIGQSAVRLKFVADWLVGEHKCPALWQPSLLPSSSSSIPQQFPLIIYSHGISGCRLFYSCICSSLASHGYVVAAIEHRDYSAAWTHKIVIEDGIEKDKAYPIRLFGKNEKYMSTRKQQLSKRVTEVVKTLHILEQLNLGHLLTNEIAKGSEFNWSQFKDRLNMSSVTLAGHSFGASTALAACAFSTDFQAAICLDAWVEPLDKDHFDKIVQPVVFLNCDKFQWESNVELMYRVLRKVSESTIFTLEAVHQAFSDFPLFYPAFARHYLGAESTVPTSSIHTVTIEMCMAFLDAISKSESILPRLREIAQRETWITENKLQERENKL
ncbi:hypothetical protein WR25_11302 [Diploscapter pachys]|uniref:1-alkyl-2-acetylglycerophosphocholine esterase n=1 Tax=Diploscapter pachys TaxID=2018661 RepID=A0A2A2K922_9BILA|nr:hypothetical protein WR25_11302 [Diploscapter pachys]